MLRNYEIKYIVDSDLRPHGHVNVTGLMAGSFTEAAYEARFMMPHNARIISVIEILE